MYYKTFENTIKTPQKATQYMHWKTFKMQIKIYLNLKKQIKFVLINATFNKLKNKMKSLKMYSSNILSDKIF